MIKAREIGLYWRTLRGLRLRQVYWRARYRLLERLAGRRVPSLQEAPSWNTEAVERLRHFAEVAAQAVLPEAARVEDLRNGRFTYVNRMVSTEDFPPWDEAGQPRLWRYHAQYGEELAVLALEYARTRCEADRERAAAWIDAWIDRHPPVRGVAWEAYPVAARLMNWSVAASVFGFSGDRLRRSLLQQARYLDRHLEYDIQANHLLKNAAALVCAGALVDERLLARGLSLLQTQITEQILDDGGHYERSPMYHAQALHDCLLAYAAAPEKPGWLAEAISRMAAFLDALRLGDGEWPFFNDCVFGQALPSDELLGLARTLCRLPAQDAVAAAFPHSGFYLLGPANRSARLIARAGPPGPEFQLGHAHCDALSYELSVGRQRVLVNSGMHDYEAGAWRDFGRSTRAHNTVQVAGREQLEAWSIFRTGRRYRCEVHGWERDAAGQKLCASHDGFAPYGHRRTIRYSTEEGYWTVLDEVDGPGSFEVESFLHFHPCCSVELEAEGALVHWKEGTLRLVLAGVDGVELVVGRESPRQGWYCPRFYTAMAAPVLVLRKAVAARGVFGYALVPEHWRAPTVLQLQAVCSLGNGLAQ